MITDAVATGTSGELERYVRPNAVRIYLSIKWRRALVADRTRVIAMLLPVRILEGFHSYFR